MKTIIVSLLIVCIFLFSITSTQGQIDYQLHFSTEQLLPADNSKQFILALEKKLVSSAEQYHYYLLQFHSLPTSSQHDQLKKQGIELLNYIPSMAYYVKINSQAMPSGILDGILRFGSPINPLWKTAPSIVNEQYPAWAMIGSQDILVNVIFHQGEEPAPLIANIAEHGWEWIRTEAIGGYITIKIPILEISDLASIEAAAYIEPIGSPPVPDNYTGRTLHRSNMITSPLTSGLHYDGTGVNILLQDDGYIGPHIDYQGRIGQQYISYNYGDHGDHVAGTIFGAGNLDPQTRGMASGATLFVHGAAPTYPGFANIATLYNNPGIRITSTSYSDGCNAGYTSRTRTMDLHMNNYPLLMHVFSAGNAGYEDCEYGAGPGWGNITGGHKMAKNVIAVANLDYRDQVAGSSSRGPANDGRIKPEVSAKGEDVYSTTNPNLYTTKSGTSMSCPGVSGTIGQLYHAYRDLNENTTPRGGIMKLILMNSADDLGNAGPDFIYGWGRINAINAFKIIEQQTYDSAYIDQEETIHHTITIPEDIQQTKIMLYWVDPPGTIGTTKALINDLDLTITSPSGETLLPLVPDHTPDPVLLNTPASAGTDHLNNAEQIVINNPEPGEYTININGYLIPQGPQQYFFSWINYTPEITITYPAGGESLVCGRQEIIRWDAPAVDYPFKIEYSPNGGTLWHTIAENASSDRRYYQWSTPSGVSNTNIIRITQNEYTTSSQPFNTLGSPQNVQINWICSNKVHLSWESVYGAISYDVLLLGDKYMEPIASTSQNSIILNDIPTTLQWISVRAIGPNGIIGERSIAIMKNGGSMNCYAKDLMTLSIPPTQWGTFQTCLNTEQIPISITLKNMGSEEISNPTVAIQINQGQITEESIIKLIKPDSTYTHIFALPLGLSQPGSHIIKAWLSHNEDENNNNDTITSKIYIVEGEPITPGNYIQNFDEFPLCQTAPVCEAIICTLSEDWINLLNEEQDAVDWRTDAGGTATGMTGPASDHTTGTANGKYLYMEPSVVCFNREAKLLSPCIDLTQTNDASVSFWYHAHGEDIGRLHLDLLQDGIIYENIMTPIAGEEEDQWKERIIDLSPWIGSMAVLRFRAYTANGQRGDLAIDDVAIINSNQLINNTKQNQFTIYPNPGSGLFTLTIHQTLSDHAIISVSDLNNRNIYHKQKNNLQKGSVTSLNLQHLPAGIYLLRIQTQQNNQYFKIIKE